MTAAADTCASVPRNLGLSASFRRHDMAAFLKVHRIEQEPVLEARALDVGLVTAVAGITCIEVIIKGRTDSAGSPPMGRRPDTMAAAARLVRAVEAGALRLSGGSRHFAAPAVGLEMLPDAANVVSSHMRLLIDIRSEEADDLTALSSTLDAAIEAVAGMDTAGCRISEAAAMAMHPTILATLTAAAETGTRACRLASGAGHDAAFLARIAHAGIAFVPCREGRSHAPEEWAATDDIGLGTAVRLNALLTLDRQGEDEGNG